MPRRYGPDDGSYTRLHCGAPPRWVSGHCFWSGEGRVSLHYVPYKTPLQSLVGVQDAHRFVLSSQVSRRQADCLASATGEGSQSKNVGEGERDTPALFHPSPWSPRGARLAAPLEPEGLDGLARAPAWNGISCDAAAGNRSWASHFPLIITAFLPASRKKGAGSKW